MHSPPARWMDEKHSSFPPIQGFLLSSRKRKAVFAALLAATVLAIAAYCSAHATIKPYRAPVYCSTWDSATKIPDEYENAVMSEYDAWCSYNKSRAINERVRHGTTQSMDTSLIRDLHNNVVDEYKPKNMAGEEFKKPEGFHIVAMIFFGRPHQVDILDCYLQQNMAEHGGFLDEVHFITHTKEIQALEWLDNLVSATSGYERIDVGPDCFDNPNSEECRYERIWERFATDPNTLYIKIDDDMVYVHEETIPRLVMKRLEHPHPFAISANLINSPTTSWLHYHTGAIYPYLPEPYPVPRNGRSPPTWRASHLPIHPDDASYQSFDFGPTVDTSLVNSAIPTDAALYRDFDLPPFPGHRWLPLTQNTTSLLHTPMSRGSVDPWGPSVHNWAIAAQQHYSLLQNIENQTLHKYWVAPVAPRGDGLWNQQYTRYNLNFIAVWGRDIVAGANVHRVSGPHAYTPHHPLWRSGLGNEWGNGIVSNLRDDEKNITADMPRALGREMVIDVQALAAHMHFHDQEVGMQMTDLLDRWRAYANENVCAPRRQKRVPGQEGGGGWTAANGGLGWWKCPWV